MTVRLSMAYPLSFGLYRYLRCAGDQQR